MSKDPIKVKQGKKSRRAGALFELKVREDLESKGLIVDRWSNQVELSEKRFTLSMGADKILNGKLVKAKSFMGRSRTNGFPDFLAFKTDNIYHGLYKVCGIEVKMKGKLSKEEKEKCKWYLENNIFAKIFIASKTETGKVKYEEFK